MPPEEEGYVFDLEHETELVGEMKEEKVKRVKRVENVGELSEVAYRVIEQLHRPHETTFSSGVQVCKEFCNDLVDLALATNDREWFRDIQCYQRQYAMPARQFPGWRKL